MIDALTCFQKQDPASFCRHRESTAEGGVLMDDTGWNMALIHEFCRLSRMIGTVP
jgi:hypothetical protein